MKLKILSFISVLVFSVKITSSQIFNNFVTFGITQEKADSIKETIIGRTFEHGLDYFNLEFGGTFYKSTLKYNYDNDLLYNGAVRSIEYDLNKLPLNIDAINRAIQPTKMQKDKLKSEYGEGIFVGVANDGSINYLAPAAIDTSSFGRIISEILNKGFTLDSIVDVDLFYSTTIYNFSKGNSLITVNRYNRLYEPNYAINYWHYCGVSIKEYADNFRELENEEKLENLRILNKNNIFSPFLIYSSYDKAKMLKDKEINITITVRDNRKCKAYKKTGISYISGQFDIYDMFGKLLYSLEELQFDVRDCMPKIIESGYTMSCNQYKYSFKPNEKWSEEILKHLASNYDVEVKLRVNKIRFSNGDIWE